MESQHAVQLAFDPTEIVLTGMFRGLEMAIGIIDSLPWPVKLIIVVLVYARLFGKSDKPRMPRARY